MPAGDAALRGRRGSPAAVESPSDVVRFRILHLWQERKPANHKLKRLSAYDPEMVQTEPLEGCDNLSPYLCHHYRDALFWYLGLEFDQDLSRHDV